MTDTEFDAVVIGSGFGGTIAAITLANYFAARNKGEKVCVLERGQWWISHELTYTPQKERKLQANMREFLTDKGEPYNFWAHPDNPEGLIDLASKARLINRAGLYDYRQIADNVSVVAASGVGGGSLVYSNVTLEPPSLVYKSWPTESDGLGLKEYFKPARIFIGVNKITTVAGAGPKNAKLEKAKVFQEAADKVRSKLGTVINPTDPNDPDLGFALDLSITDIPDSAFNNLTPDKIGQASPSQIAEVLKQQNQQNVCQRQGRCNLGCLPGARHTLNKKIIREIQQLQQTNTLIIKPLCEAYLIESVEPDKYRVHYKRYDKQNDTVSRENLNAKILVVGAGTLGTNELLLKSVEEGLKLSKRLGKGFSTDGDLLGVMRLRRRRVDITRGPINTCHAFFKTTGKDFAFSIEDTTLPKMVAPIFATIFDLMTGTKKRGIGVFSRLIRTLKLTWRYGLLSVLSGVSLSTLQKTAARILRNTAVQSVLVDLAMAKDVADPWKYVRNDEMARITAETIDWFTKDHENPPASPEQRLSRYFVFSCMGLDNADGELALRTDWRELDEANSLQEKLQLKWSFEKNRRAFEAIVEGMRQLADEIEEGGAANVYVPTWDAKAPDQSSSIVLHPLGGCAMGRSTDEGVVNVFGQVFRDDPSDRTRVYPNFYVIDGSIVPSALGVNSSLTISALAFRCVEHLVGDKKFWPGFDLIEKMQQLGQ